MVQLKVKTTTLSRQHRVKSGFAGKGKPKPFYGLNTCPSDLNTLGINVSARTSGACFVFFYLGSITISSTWNHVSKEVAGSWVGQGGGGGERKEGVAGNMFLEETLQSTVA